MGFTGEMVKGSNKSYDVAINNEKTLLFYFLIKFSGTDLFLKKKKRKKKEKTCIFSLKKKEKKRRKKEEEKTVFVTIGRNHSITQKSFLCGQG